MSDEVKLIGVGATFTTAVSFDNLTPTQLGSLLIACVPQLAFEDSGDKPIAIRLGGGKPFGWGACSAEFSDLKLTTASSRYLGEQEAEAEAMAPKLDACIKLGREALYQGTLGRLKKVLTVDPDGINEADIAYPDFELWKETAGIQAPGRSPRWERPLVSLPDPAADDQRVISRAKEPRRR